MKVKREELLEALQTVKPAIGSKGDIEELSCVWFDGKYVSAMNDKGFGIRVPCTIPLDGGVNGMLLIHMLNNYKVKEVEFAVEDNKKKQKVLVMRAGKSRLTLPMVIMTDEQRERKLIHIPNLKADNAFTPSVDFYAAIGMVKFGTGKTDNASPEQAGITIIKDKQLYVFSCSEAGATLARVNLDGKGWPLKEQISIPVVFAEQLLTLSKGEEKNTKLEIVKLSRIRAQVRETILTSPLLASDAPQDLLAISNKMVDRMKFTNIPGKLKLAMARATIMLGDESAGVIDIAVKGDVLSISTKSIQSGLLKDRVALEDNNQPEIEIRVSPKLVSKGLGYSNKIGMSDQALVLHSKNFYYLVAKSS